MPTVIDEILQKRRLAIKKKMVPAIISEVLKTTDFEVYNELTDEEIEKMVEDKHEVICASSANVSAVGAGTSCCIGIGCTGGSYCA